MLSELFYTNRGNVLRDPMGVSEGRKRYCGSTFLYTRLLGRFTLKDLELQMDLRAI